MKSLFIKYFISAIFGFAVLTTQVCAQIKTNVKLSNPYATRAKALGLEYKQYKKYLKDSIRNVRRLNKLYQSKIDSLVNIDTDDAIQWSGLELPGYDSADLTRSTNGIRTQYNRYRLDYLKYKDDSLNLDSLIQNQYDQYEQQYLGQNGMDEQRLDLLTPQDTLMIDSIASNAHDPLLAYRDQKLRDMESRIVGLSGAGNLVQTDNPIVATKAKMNGYQAQVNRYTDKKNLKANMQQLTASHVQKYGQSIQNAHESMASLKKKYVTLPSLEDVSLGVKRNSLKGQPLGKRLKIGGNLHIRQTNTVDVDFSPSIAYRLNRKWSAGMEGMYRSQFGGDKELTNAFDPSTYGLRVFTEYLFFKGLFVRGDVETLRQSSEPGSVNANDLALITGALAGMGKSIRISDKVGGKVMVQYNFLHKNNGLYNSQRVVRFGFDLKSFGKKKDKKGYKSTSDN